MYLKTLQLKNFRNFIQEGMEFSPRINILIGRNAQGKTNIVESINLLATGGSFRTHEFRDMLKWNMEFAGVCARACGKKGDDDLRVELGLEKKVFYRNEKRTTPGGFDGLNAVLFAPEEMLFLRDSPSARRRYIDSLISQLDPSYHGMIRRYEKVVSHRNRLLKDSHVSRSKIDHEMEVWDAQLVDIGAKIISRRDEWCEVINKILPGRYATLANGDGRALFIYRPHCGDMAKGAPENDVRDMLKEQLAVRKADEMERGISLVGPHRDDLEARIENAAVKQFGSQGQLRTFVLALKITEIDILTENIGEPPALLLDDVASELDAERNQAFFDLLLSNNGQIFITATDASDLKIERTSDVREFRIENGRAQEMSLRA